jgi:hypothetical protein
LAKLFGLCHNIRQPLKFYDNNTVCQWFINEYFLSNKVSVEIHIGLALNNQKMVWEIRIYWIENLTCFISISQSNFFLLFTAHSTTWHPCQSIPKFKRKSRYYVSLSIFFKKTILKEVIFFTWETEVKENNEKKHKTGKNKFSTQYYKTNRKLVERVFSLTGWKL